MSAKNDPSELADEARGPSSSEQLAAKDQPAVRKRRRWRYWVGLPLLALTLLVAFAPYLASSGPVLRLMVSAANDQLAGRVELDRISLAWFGPCELRGVRVADPAGREVLAVDQIVWKAGIWRALTSIETFGEVRIVSPRAILFVDDDGVVSLVQAFALRKPAPEKESSPLPSLTGRLVLSKGSLEVVRPDGRKYEMPQVDVECDLDALRDLKATLAARLADGQTLSVEAAIEQLTSNGELQLSGASGVIKIATSSATDIGGPSRVAFSQTRTAGRLHLNAEAAFRPDDVRCDVNVRLLGLEVAGKKAAEVNPTDVSFGGRVRVTADSAVADVSLAGPAVNARVRLDCVRPVYPGNLSPDTIAAAALTGKESAFPRFTAEASSDVDLAALTRAVPGLLALRPDVKITGGKLAIDGLTVHGGPKPELKGTLKLAQLVAVRGDRTIRWEPITLDLNAVLETGQGLRVDRAELDSGFARVVARGTASQLQAEAKADLARLYEQLGQVVDVGSAEWAGEVAATLGVKRVDEKRVDVACDATGSDLRYRTRTGILAFQKVTVKHDGHVALMGAKVTGLAADAVMADFDGKIVCTGSGSFDLKRRAIRAALDVKDADLAYAGSKAAQWGLKDPARFAGKAEIGIKIDQESGSGPVASEGSIVLRDFAVDGSPLTDQDIALGWSGARVASDVEEVSIESAELRNAVVNATARQVRLQYGKPFLLEGALDATADVAKGLAVAARVGRWKETPRIAGRLTIATSGRSSGGGSVLSGNCRIDSLEIGAGQGVVREKQVDLAYNAAMNIRDETIALKELKLVSNLLSLNANGTMSRYSSECMLAMSGSYEGSWEAISSLMHEFAPATRDTVAFAGTTTSRFTVTGRARQPEARPPYRGLVSGLDVGWASADTYGVRLDKGALSPSLRDGEVNVPLATISASGGKVRLGGTIDLRPAVPTFRLPGSVQLFDRVPISPKLGSYLLSRVNPVFAGMSRVEGTASLATQDVLLPLGEEILRSGQGRGRLDLADVRMQPVGLLGALLKLGGFGLDDLLAVKFSGADFVLKNGRVSYDDFTMTFPNDFDLKFHGSVGLDDTMELWVSVPVRPALLEQFGVGLRAKEYAAVLADVRVDIPISGSRLHPQLDLSRVDMKPLIERASRVLIRDGAGKLLDVLSKPKQPEKK